jgi:hypothetical protein
MSLLFDATVKDLAQDSPSDFLQAFDTAPTDPVRFLNVDLSTVTTSADIVFGVGEPLREVIHLEAQASAAEGKHRDVFVYNGLLHRLYRVPVHSIVLLLRPQAGHANLSGVLRYEPRPGRGWADFRYEVVRLWERPAALLLGGGLGTLPLAPLGQLPSGVPPEQGLAPIIQQLADRLQREATAAQARKLLTAAFVLTGLRVPRGLARDLYRGVTAMHESDTYQAILDEGGIRELHRTLLRLGRKRFGDPDPATQAALTTINEHGSSAANDGAPARRGKLAGTVADAVSASPERTQSSARSKRRSVPGSVPRGYCHARIRHVSGHSR